MGVQHDVAALALAALGMDGRPELGPILGGRPSVGHLVVGLATIHATGQRFVPFQGDEGAANIVDNFAIAASLTDAAWLHLSQTSEGSVDLELYVPTFGLADIGSKRLVHLTHYTFSSGGRQQR